MLNRVSLFWRFALLALALTLISAGVTNAISNASKVMESSEQSQPLPSQPPAIAQTNIAPSISTLQTQQRIAGFSLDGKYYMYVESWRDTGAGISQAALQTIDVATNGCVANGCVQTRFTEANAGQSLEAAESSLLQQSQSLRQTLKLAAPVAGTKLPVSSRSRTEDGTEIVTVTLSNNQPLQLRLQPQGATNQAAMQLEVNYAGKQRSISPLNQPQSESIDFSIREVQQSPDGKTIVVLLTAVKPTYEGALGRTLVQSFEL